METFHRWNERLTLSSGEVPASEEEVASTAELCSVHFSLLTLLWNNGIAVTFCLLCLFTLLFVSIVFTDTFVRDRGQTEGSRYRD